MKNNLTILVAALLLFAGCGAAAADYSGRYVAEMVDGTMTLDIEQDGDGEISGVLSDGFSNLDLDGEIGPDGIEGGPAIANLAMAMQAAQQAQSGGSVTHGYGKGGGARGTLAGGMYSGRTASGKSVLWCPGM